MKGMYNTFYDLNKATLWADKPLEGGTMNPRLVLSFRDGNPRFVVYTGIQGVMMNFPCEHQTVTAIMNVLEDLAENGKNDSYVNVTSETNVWENGTRTDKKRLVSTLRIGKSKSGIMYIMIDEKDKPKVPFALNKTDWHSFRTDNGDDFEPATLSKYFAKSFAKLTKLVVAHAINEYAKDSAKHSDYPPKEIEPYDPNKFKGGKKPISKGSEGIPQPSTASKEMTFDEDVLF